MHMRQRNVQMRVEDLNSFAWSLGADDRGAQEQ